MDTHTYYKQHANGIHNGRIECEPQCRIFESHLLTNANNKRFNFWWRFTIRFKLLLSVFLLLLFMVFRVWNVWPMPSRFLMHMRAIVTYGMCAREHAFEATKWLIANPYKIEPIWMNKSRMWTVLFRHCFSSSISSFVLFRSLLLCTLPLFRSAFQLDVFATR